MDPRDNAVRDSVTVTVKPERPEQSSAPPALRLDTSASPQHSQSGGASGPSPLAEREHRASKIAACLSCRRSKVRCEKGPDPVRCRRCAQTGGDCVRPTFNVGRRKGVKK